MGPPVNDLYSAIAVQLVDCCVRRWKSNNCYFSIIYYTLQRLYAYKNLFAPTFDGKKSFYAQIKITFYFITIFVLTPTLTPLPNSTQHRPCLMDNRHHVKEEACNSS